MVDSTSGTGGINQHRPVPQSEAAKVKGEKDGKSIQSLPPKNSQLDKTPSQVPDTGIQARQIVGHPESLSVNTDHLNQMRHLALENKWPAFASAFHLHVNNEPQFHQVMDQLTPSIQFPAETQIAISDKFSQIMADQIAKELTRGLS